MKFKKYLPVILPIAAGIVIGAAILAVKPNTGKRLGDLIYSSHLLSEGYSYAVSRAAPSVVNIYVANMNKDYTKPDKNSITTSASGVVIDRQGLIITNYHVVPYGNEPNKAIWVQTRDGKLLNALVAGSDRRTDLAILVVNDTTLTPISICETEPKVGDIVLAIGNPNNLGQTVTHGIISATSRSGSGLLTKDQMNIRQGVQDLIQTDAPINAGNSGGALVNTKGQLLGINTASFSGASSYGIGFSVPVKLVEYVKNEIIQHGRVARGYLGIADDENFILGGASGVKIDYIDPQGPAFGVLKVGDIIKSVNGVTISDVKVLIDMVSQSKPGRTLEFTIERDDVIKVLNITLAEDKTSVE